MMRASCAGAIVVGLATQVALAQWSVTRLHPAGADGSSAEGGGPGAVGYVGFFFAAWWPDGTAGGYVSLHPAGADRSHARTSAEGVQAGWINVDGPGFPFHAAVWRGTASSFVDLHPSGYDKSRIFGTDGVQQVGEADDRAGVWQRTAGSFVELHPPGANQSIAWDVHDGVQAGVFVTDEGGRAAVWRGSAGSMIDLHPAGTEGSVIRATRGGQHGGTVVIDGRSNGAVWNADSADAWVGLTPPGARGSEVYDVYDGFQSGFVRSTTTILAALWRGDAFSLVDLHDLLPASFVSSTAYGVWHDDDTLYVVGQGNNAGVFEALMWSRPFCPPDFDLDGALTIFDFLAFQSDFDAGNLSADLDGDGELTIFDFLAFQSAFVVGC